MPLPDAVVVTNDIRHDLERFGHLARTSQLAALGHTRTAINAAIRTGWMTRPVRPWVATYRAERDGVIAVLHRGKLTDASALGSHGVWRGLDRSIHVLVPPKSSGSIARCSVPLANFAVDERISTSGVVRHWARESVGGSFSAEWRVSPVDALVSFAHSQPRDQFVAALDSALYTRQLRPSEVRHVASLLPARLRDAIPDADGRAEAGTETLARLRLRPIAPRIDIQVPIGSHRVDLLIDGWLAVEIDSERWHASTRRADSQRDTWLTMQGYWVIHFDYYEVMFEWDKCAAAIIGLLRYPPAVSRRSSSRRTS